MQANHDETEPPVTPAPPVSPSLPGGARHGDLLAVTTFWLALAGNATILFSRTQWSRISVPWVPRNGHPCRGVPSSGGAVVHGRMSSPKRRRRCHAGLRLEA